MAAAMPLLHTMQESSFDVTGSPVTTGRSDTPVASSRSWLQDSAQSFLRESLSLTQRCQANCAPAGSEIAEAEKFGRLGPSASPLAGLPVQQHFGLQMAPEVTEVVTVAVPAPVRVAPSVVVPLAPAGSRVAPVPAPRLERPAGDAGAIGTNGRADGTGLAAAR